MYAFKGMNNIFYPEVFKEYAKLRGYNPIIIDAWATREAVPEFFQKLKKNGDADSDYIIYGYSLGVQSGREAIYKGAKPVEFVAVGPYSELKGIDKLPVSTVIYGDASSGHYGILKDQDGKPITHDKIMYHVLTLEKEKYNVKGNSM
jgi:hypothetical protein